MPFNLDAGGFSTGQGMEFFHPHTRGAHAFILERCFGDALGQCLGQIDMALGDDGADLVGEGFIIHHHIQPVFQHGRVFHRQIDVNPQGLLFALFMAMDPDMGRELQIADKDMTDGKRRVGNA